MPGIKQVNYKGTLYDILPDELAQKANIDGAYESMTVGNAEQLVSTVFIEDQVPYNYRTAGGSADIGDREYDTIVGGTVGWNQLFRGNARENGGITYSRSDDYATETISGTATETSYNQLSNMSVSIIDHVYYVDKGNEETNYTIYNDSGGVNTGTRRSTIGKATVEKRFYIRIKNGATVDFSVTPQIIDLTQLFGSTIADYIYSLEQSTTGAGVQWFKKLFPKDYYEYNSGELQSTEDLQSHDTVEFNQWDEEWELGSIDGTTGAKVSSNTSIRSKNYIPCFPNTQYYCCCKYLQAYSGRSIAFYCYDINENYIGRPTPTGVNNNTFTTPDGCYYLMFRTGGNEYPTTYQNDICINLHWDGERDGEYEPYKKHSYPLDSTLILRGKPNLDANGNLYYDGDIYESDGTVTRRYGVVDLGTLVWNLHSSGQFRASFPQAKSASTFAIPANILCPKYTTVSQNVLVQEGTDKAISKAYASVDGFNVKDSAYTDAASFKAAMSGVYLIYEAVTPTTESAEPFQSPQIVDDFGTEEYVTTSIVPVGHVTKYANNLRAKLEMAPDSPDGDGDYIVRQTNGENSYVPLVLPTELPAAPTTDGSYKLKCTVTDGTPVYSWEVES